MERTLNREKDSLILADKVAVVKTLEREVGEAEVVHAPPVMLLFEFVVPNKPVLKIISQVLGFGVGFPPSCSVSISSIRIYLFWSLANSSLRRYR